MVGGGKKYLLQGIQAGSGTNGHFIWGWIFQGVKLTLHHPLVQRLRLSEATASSPPNPHHNMPSWHAQGKLYFQLYNIDNRLALFHVLF